MNKIKVFQSNNYFQIESQIEDFFNKNINFEIVSVYGYQDKNTNYLTYVLYNDKTVFVTYEPSILNS